MIREAISAMVDGRDLEVHEAKAVMLELMSGSATQSQVGAFLTACRMKGETEDELVGFALAMRESSEKLVAPRNAVDLCGTGGDGKGTFNISTVASFIVSACGVPVAKHGNRSVSSTSGSADLLDALGIPCDLDPASVQASLDTTGFGFMFAPVFHSSMRNVVVPRREVGIRTVFNILGPLTNPARVTNQLMGIYDPDISTKVVMVMSRLGVERAMVVNGSGTDEISNLGRTQISELKDGRVKRYSVAPSDFGLDHVEPEALAVDSPLDSARTTMSVLKDEGSPCRDAALMNAAAGLYVAGAVQDLDHGFSMAAHAVETGKALEKLREIASFVRSREEARQSSMQVSALRSRRIMPSVLKARATELTSALRTEIMSLPGGKERLDALDPTLLSEPSVLSVISLSRLHSTMSKGMPEGDAKSRSGRSFVESIGAKGVSVIGEYKPRSPSTGGAYVPPSPATTAEAYARSGMAAMSVLVEDRFFGGSPEMFSFIREKTDLPMLFKDFVVTDEQLDMAERLGADAVLLIAKVLGKESLDRFIRTSVSKGIEPLVELHDLADIEKLASCGSRDMVRVVGLNSRDLRTLATDISALGALREALPHGKLVVAESGLRTGSDMQSLKGFDAVLVGTALMESQDILRAAEEMVSAGRSVSR